MEKIKIGTSDHSRKELEAGKHGIGDSPEEFLRAIKHYERNGYNVKFETSILRKMFCVGIYKIIAYK